MTVMIEPVPGHTRLIVTGDLETVLTVPYDDDGPHRVGKGRLDIIGLCDQLDTRNNRDFGDAMSVRCMTRSAVRFDRADGHRRDAFLSAFQPHPRISGAPIPWLHTVRGR